jgi:tetratricopeptide (TPR) repeat protein
MAEHQHQSSPPAGVSPWVWVMLGLLLIVALAVIFVLPRVVEQYELPLAQRVQPAAPPAVAVDSTPVTTQVSPFEEAQRARQRRQSQDVLAELLRAQARLEDMAVLEWGRAAYDEAISHAREGDELYRTGDFAGALAAYEQGREALTGLLERLPEMYARTMAEGEQALLAADSALAEDRFRLALRFDPQSQDADAGLGRALTLDEVTDLIREAEALQDEGEYRAARSRLQQAVELDSLHEQAQQMLAQSQVLIRDADFGRAMSEGFALLQGGEADAAIAAFERALTIRPGAAQAEEAIRQTQEQITNAVIAGHRERARQAASREAWQEAIDAYEAALALDANLLFAADGLDYAERRLQLDQLLQRTISEPFRLAEPEVYDYTRNLYQTGRSLGDAGARLQQQLEQVAALLEQARVPVEVELLSDNSTHVTVYQVAELGRFSQERLTLQPGRYVAVGTRPGYRDVRVEFLVGFGQQPGPISISCQEQVAAVNSRR